MLSGATGIAACAVRLALEAGARVCVVSLRQEDCDTLRQDLQAGEDRLLTVAGDLSEAATADRAATTCSEAFGRIDLLFNVAGLSGRRFGDGPVHECTDEGFDETVRGNLRTLFLLSRATLRQMLAQAPGDDGMRGAILHMATVTAYSPQRDFFATHAYAAAKGGVIGLTRAMASYYAPHKIRVNAIAPGLVRTPMSLRAQSNQAIQELMRRKQPLAESMIDADDVARTALFLLGDSARMVTGAGLGVDAGWTVSG
ncbi:MAG: SDR family oxidoreductase [Bryobacterales bacterium]|nr:SDR family oxidoreductase [Bryobacterales bacterium]